MSKKAAGVLIWAALYVTQIKTLIRDNYFKLWSVRVRRSLSSGGQEWLHFLQQMIYIEVRGGWSANVANNLWPPTFLSDPGCEELLLTNYDFRHDWPDQTITSQTQ